jgi:hypothetical protein
MREIESCSCCFWEHTFVTALHGSTVTAVVTAVVGGSQAGRQAGRVWSLIALMHASRWQRLTYLVTLWDSEREGRTLINSLPSSAGCLYSSRIFMCDMGAS